jgi:hypothetical protein
MKRTYGFLVLGVVVLSMLVATTQHAAASCATDDPDGSKRATARASAEQACTDAGNGCATALNHGAYVSCIAQGANAAVKNGSLPASCKSAVKKCAARSTCGKPGFVACCAANPSGHGKSTCAIKKDAASCTAKSGSCAGHFASCCDACGQDGSCNPPPATTTTTTLLPSPTTTTL